MAHKKIFLTTGRINFCCPYLIIFQLSGQHLFTSKIGLWRKTGRRFWIQLACRLQILNRRGWYRSNRGVSNDHKKDREKEAKTAAATANL